MKRLLYTTLASCALFLTSCIKNDYWVNPNPEPPRLNRYQYVDEFDDNRGDWNFVDGANSAYGVITNGTFKFDYNSNTSQAYYVSKNIVFNSYNDFVLESKIGSDNNFGILFGYDARQGSYGYSFTVNYNGQFALYDEGGNGYGPDIQEIIRPTYDNAVRRNGDWNTVRIDQVGNRWIGYVNNIQVFNIQARNLKAGSIGFVAVPFTKGEADYIQADWYE